MSVQSTSSQLIAFPQSKQVARFFVLFQYQVYQIITPNTIPHFWLMNRSQKQKINTEVASDGEILLSIDTL